jgi:hypothetical protein
MRGRRPCGGTCHSCEGGNPACAARPGIGIPAFAWGDVRVAVELRVALSGSRTPQVWRPGLDGITSVLHKPRVETASGWSAVDSSQDGLPSPTDVSVKRRIRSTVLRDGRTATSALQEMNCSSCQPGLSGCRHRLNCAALRLAFGKTNNTRRCVAPAGVVFLPEVLKRSAGQLSSAPGVSSVRGGVSLRG